MRNALRCKALRMEREKGLEPPTLCLGSREHGARLFSLSPVQPCLARVSVTPCHAQFPSVSPRGLAKD